MNFYLKYIKYKLKYINYKSKLLSKKNILPPNFQKELHNIIESKCLHEIDNFIEPYRCVIRDIISNKEIVKPNIKQGIITSILRYYIMINDDININIIIKHSNMVRDFLEIMAYKNNEEFNKDLFNCKVNIYIITPKNISFIIENQLNYLLNLLDGKFIKGEKKDFPILTDTSILKKYKMRGFTEDYIKKISQDINNKKSLEDFIIYLEKNNNYDVILDAGNILHSSSKGIEDPKNLKSVIDYYNKNNLKPLIIIHQSHIKNCKKYLTNELHFYTPIKNNDDLFILVAYLKKMCTIITNDQYGDHIDKYKSEIRNHSNDLGGHLKDDIQNYKINNYEFYKLNIINNYSNCIQVINKYIYIPTDKEFIIINN